MAPGLCSQGTWPTLTLIGRARDLQGLWPARLPQLDEKPPKGKSFFFSILHYPAGPSFPLATERTSLFGMAKGAIDTDLSANLGRPCSGHQKFPFPHFAFFFFFSFFPVIVVTEERKRIKLLHSLEIVKMLRDPFIEILQDTCLLLVRGHCLVDTYLCEMSVHLRQPPFGWPW